MQAAAFSDAVLAWWREHGRDLPWRRTRDPLFLSFAIAFIVEACNRVCLLFIDKPNEGKPVIYLVRLVVFLVLLIAIIKKNVARGPVRN